MIIYFSGTGNSEYVAKAIADRTGDEIINSFDYIKNGIAGDFKSGNPWIFVFPVYLSTVAQIFADFLRSSDFDGIKNAYFVGTCASSIGSSSNVCAQICRLKGLKYMGIARVQMPQNYIALFKMTPEAEINRRIDASIKEIDAITNAILKGLKLDTKQTSRFEFAATKIVEKMYNGPFTKTKKFYATEKCTGCGLCERNCPLNKITVTNGKPSWEGSCSHCMSCINRCPIGAIEYGKGTKDKKRYVCRKYTTKSDNNN